MPKLSSAQSMLLSMMPVDRPICIDDVKEIIHKQTVMDNLVRFGLVEQEGDLYTLKKPIEGASHRIPTTTPYKYRKLPDDKKKCRGKCKQFRPLDDFYKKDRNRDGYEGVCKSCQGIARIKNGGNIRVKVRVAPKVDKLPSNCNW